MASKKTDTSFTLELMARELRAALEIASTVTDHGLKIPVLKSTRIEISDGRATFIATNTDHAIRASAPATGSGIVHLDTAMLTQKAAILRPDEPVRISGDDKFVSATQGRAKWRLPVIIGDDFPVRAVDEIAGTAVTIPAKPFLTALSAVTAIINPGDNRVFGQGPYFDITDGFRIVGCGTLGLFVVQLTNGPARSVIIPNKSVQAITAIFKDATSLDMIADDKAFTLSDGDVLYRSKMIEGAYTDWRRPLKIVNANALRITVNSADILASLDRATAIKEDQNKSGRWVGVRLTFAGGECTVQAANRDGEEGVDIFPCEGDDGTFGVAAGVLRSAIESLNCEKIELAIAETEAPIRISGVNPGPDNYRIVMPLRVA